MSVEVIHSEIISNFSNHGRSSSITFKNINTIFGTFSIIVHAQIMVKRGHQTTYYKLWLFRPEKIILSLVEVTNKQSSMEYNIDSFHLKANS